MKTAETWAAMAGGATLEHRELLFKTAMAEARADERDELYCELAEAIGGPISSKTTVREVVDLIRAEGRKAGLEEAAKLADNYQAEAIVIAETKVDSAQKTWSERSIAAAHVAQDIRALAEKEEG